MKRTRYFGRNGAFTALLLVLCLALMAVACAPADAQPLPVSTSADAEKAETAAAAQDTTEADDPAPSVKQPKRDRMLLWPSDVAAETIVELPESEQEIAPGVTLKIAGDVTIPAHGKLQSIGVKKASVTEEAAVSILCKLQPDAEWSLIHYDTQNSVRATCTVEGVNHSAVFGTTSGDRVSSFYYAVEPGSVIREGYLMNDQELMDDWGELLDMEIPVDRDAAMAQAEAVLALLGVDDMMLQAAEKGCQLENDDIENPLSLGWVFVYVPSLDGLPVYFRLGGTGFNDKVYPTVQHSRLCVYVTEQGVKMVDWSGIYQRTEVLSEEVSIVSCESVLDAAVERLCARYGDWPGNERTLSIIGMQLAAGMIGSEQVSDDAAFGSHIDAGRLVPVWEVVCTAEEKDSAYYDFTMVLPFCALDGGAMMVQE